MSKYIDADKLHYIKVGIHHNSDYPKNDIVVFAKEIDKAETVDMIPVNKNETVGEILTKIINPDEDGCIGIETRNGVITFQIKESLWNSIYNSDIQNKLSKADEDLYNDIIDGLEFEDLSEGYGFSRIQNAIDIFKKMRDMGIKITDFNKKEKDKYDPLSKYEDTDERGIEV